MFWVFADTTEILDWKFPLTSCRTVWGDIRFGKFGQNRLMVEELRLGSFVRTDPVPLLIHVYLRGSYKGPLA